MELLGIARIRLAKQDLRYDCTILVVRPPGLAVSPASVIVVLADFALH
jgi:hypothetical protein